MQMEDVSYITSKLAITDARTVKEISVVDLGFDAVLCLDINSFQNTYGVESEIISLRIDNPDSNVFDAAVMQLKTWNSEGKQILVHCNHGLSRSVAVVAAFLAQEGGDSEESLRYVASHRRGLDQVDKSFQNFALRYYA